MPPTEKLDMNECEESLDSDRYEIEMIDETDGSMGSSVSDSELVVDPSPSSNFKDSICLQQSPGRMKHDSSDNVSPHFGAGDFDCSWSVETDTQDESSAMVIEKRKEFYGVAEGILTSFLSVILLVSFENCDKFYTCRSFKNCSYDQF